jgi:hypothetical protein
MMKKQLFLLVQLLIPMIVCAQENNNTTYSVVKVAGIVVVAGFVIWGFSRWKRKKK